MVIVMTGGTMISVVRSSVETKEGNRVGNVC